MCAFHLIFIDRVVGTHQLARMCFCQETHMRVDSNIIIPFNILFDLFDLSSCEPSRGYSPCQEGRVVVSLRT